MHTQKTASYQIDCFCEDYSELDALDLIRIKYELKKSSRFKEGIIHLEKAIEAFSKVDCDCENFHYPEASSQQMEDSDNVRSEQSIPSSHLTET